MASGAGAGAGMAVAVAERVRVRMARMDWSCIMAIAVVTMAVIVVGWA